MEAQLKQTEQRLSKQITEECQAVQLRSGKTLNTSRQGSRKPRNEQTNQNSSEDSKSPERNNSGAQTPENGWKAGVERPNHAQSGRPTPKTSKELALNAQVKLSSGVQMPETDKELASNATPASTPGIRTPVGDQTHTSADNNPSKKASQPTSVGNKPAATKVEEYKAKMPYPHKLRQAEQDKQFAHFADYLRTPEIKIPFAEALEQIPSYAKFVKEILSHKKD